MDALLEQIHKTMRAIEQLTGTPVLWKKPSGIAGDINLPLSQITHCNAFCEKVKLKNHVKCQQHDSCIIAPASQATDESFLKPCHAGVVELIVPIINNGNYEGQLMFGPIRNPDTRGKYKNCDSLFKQLNSYGAEELESVSQLLKAVIELIKQREKSKIYQLRDTVSNIKIQRAIEYINKNIDKQLSASAVAKNSFLSTSRFLHLFKETCGITFSDYITKQKIEKSKKLLLDTRQSISEICYQCGFTSQSYFGSIFRKVTQQTPSEYRQTYQIIDQV